MAAALSDKQERTMREAVAALNRCMRKTDEFPLAVEKTVMLQMLKNLLERLKQTAATLGVELTNLPAVEKQIEGIEEVCRDAGLFAAYDRLPRARRRQFQRQVEAAR